MVFSFLSRVPRNNHKSPFSSNNFTNLILHTRPLLAHHKPPRRNKHRVLQELILLTPRLPRVSPLPLVLQSTHLKLRHRNNIPKPGRLRVRRPLEDLPDLFSDRDNARVRKRN
jgi:hypothetical protein